jgi:peptidyl-tRNA hydrolase
VVVFILARFKQSELGDLNAVVKRSCDAIESIVTEGVPVAMNTYNTL